MNYTSEQKAKICAESKGKTIESLEYDDEENYWVMTFRDGTETSFRFMSELIGEKAAIKLKIQSCVIIAGKEPIIQIDPGVYSESEGNFHFVLEMLHNHLLVRNALPWYKRLFLRIAGIKKVTGNITLTRKVA